jgi:hypothetical protein
MSLRQLITPDAQDKRLEIATSQLELMEQDPEFIDNLIVSDEAHFPLHAVVNSHNFLWWSTKNPHWYREVPLHPPKLTVWAAIGRKGVVGPVFITGTVTGKSYLELLEERFLPDVQEWDNFDEMIFMQDGAPPHWALIVRAWLDENFPG